MPDHQFSRRPQKSPAHGRHLWLVLAQGFAVAWMFRCGISVQPCFAVETIPKEMKENKLPTTITMPKDEEEWIRIKGKEFSVDLHATETQTRITLPARVRVAIVPHPTDSWFCTWDVTDPTPVDWRGDMHQPEGLTKQLQIKAFTMGGANNGPVQVDKDKGKATWINVFDLPGMAWTGPGMIRFRGQLRGAPGYGKGIIRVKIVPLAAL